MKPATNNSILRPPVVAVMGHIDHGKSTLLDYIRKTNITDKEIGGITQTISAYEITHLTSSGKASAITFLDTPGHEAFVAMRDRGARIADIAILVVSAEDGVKTQTLEALRSIKDAKLPYIVAINKIDKEAANVERTKQSLAENEIYIEGYGGDVPAIPLSAKTGKGVPELLDMVLLLAELQELTAEAEAPGEGIVLEAQRHKATGISATLIIKNGTVRTGMFIVAGESLSPIRALENFKGEKISVATFSSPVRIVGFDSTPVTGSIFRTFASKKDAELYQTESAEKNKSTSHSKTNAEAGDEAKFVVPVLIKANHAGTLDAIAHEISKIKHDRLIFKIVAQSVGDVTENDIKLASAKEHTSIIAFGVKVDAAAKNLADRFELEIKSFDIIYKVSDYLMEVVAKQAPKISVEEKTGAAKILKLFSHVKDRQIIGARVEEGLVGINEEVKIYRREAEIGRGHVRELQHLKSKVTEVNAGTEFGAMIESKTELAPGDKIECFKIIEK